MAALAESVAAFSLVRRVITRNAALGGEDFEAVSEPEFERQRQIGAFCIDWRAHGLRYGIPKEVRMRVGKGEELLVNLSRDVLVNVATAFPSFTVLNITATPETLAARLTIRGREAPEDIERRLQRGYCPLPTGFSVATVENNGALKDAVDSAIALLHPARA